MQLAVNVCVPSARFPVPRILVKSGFPPLSPVIHQVTDPQYPGAASMSQNSTPVTVFADASVKSSVWTHSVASLPFCWFGPPVVNDARVCRRSEAQHHRQRQQGYSSFAHSFLLRDFTNASWSNWIYSD